MHEGDRLFLVYGKAVILFLLFFREIICSHQVMEGIHEEHEKTRRFKSLYIRAVTCTYREFVL